MSIKKAPDLRKGQDLFERVVWKRMLHALSGRNLSRLLLLLWLALPVSGSLEAQTGKGNCEIIGVHTLDFGAVVRLEIVFDREPGYKVKKSLTGVQVTVSLPECVKGNGVPGEKFMQSPVLNNWMIRPDEKGLMLMVNMDGDFEVRYQLARQDSIRLVMDILEPLRTSNLRQLEQYLDYYTATGQDQSAFDIIETITAEHPEYSGIYYRKALLQLKYQQEKQAAESLQNVRSGDASYDQAQDLLEKLSFKIRTDLPQKVDVAILHIPEPTRPENIIKPRHDGQGPQSYRTPELEGLRFVLIEEGSFIMGSEDGSYDQRPPHQVTVSAFFIANAEVPQRLWTSVMNDNPSTKVHPGLPVHNVSWFNAVSFCNNISEATGLKPAYTIDGSDVKWNKSANGFRLPTEAEWEYAARGGTQAEDTQFSGSSEPDLIAWYQENSGDSLHASREKEPNELGLFDMSGNLAEWCWDWYSRETYESHVNENDTYNPDGPDIGTTRVMRGGSWESYISSGELDVTDRKPEDPNDSDETWGLRLVRTGGSP